MPTKWVVPTRRVMGLIEEVVLDQISDISIESKKEDYGGESIRIAMSLRDGPPLLIRSASSGTFILLLY